MLTRDGMASALKALGVSIAPWQLNLVPTEVSSPLDAALRVGAFVRTGQQRKRCIGFHAEDDPGQEGSDCLLYNTTFPRFDGGCPRLRIPEVAPNFLAKCHGRFTSSGIFPRSRPRRSLSRSLATPQPKLLRRGPKCDSLPCRPRFVTMKFSQGATASCPALQKASLSGSWAM